MDAEEKKKAGKASELIVEIMTAFSDMDLDPDYAAYLLLAAGYGLAVSSNRNSPIVVNQLVASAILLGHNQILEQEKDEEEDEDETYH